MTCLLLDCRLPCPPTLDDPPKFDAYALMQSIDGLISSDTVRGYCLPSTRVDSSVEKSCQVQERLPFQSESLFDTQKLIDECVPPTCCLDHFLRKLLAKLSQGA
jgi:hypothetical protein